MLSEHRFDTGTVSINYAEDGQPSGPPLVLLHGGSGRWQAWQEAIPLFAGRWHVYAPDARGHGKSGRVAGRYRYVDYAADLVVFLGGVSGPAAVFGHSMGAVTALIAAAQRPELVRALIVGDVPFSLDRLRAHIAPTRDMLVSWRSLCGLPPGEIAAALREVLVVGDGDTTPRPAAQALGKESPWFAFMGESLSLLDPDQLTAVIEFDEMHEGYGERLLAEIRCPVLLLQGDPARGAAMSDADVERAFALLPSATLVRFDGLGHALHWLEPERVLPHVIEFLESVEVPA